MAKTLQQTLADYQANALQNRARWDAGERDGLPLPENSSDYSDGIPLFDNAYAKNRWLHDNGFVVLDKNDIANMANPRFSNMAGRPVIDQMVALYGPKARNWTVTPDGSGGLIFDTGTGQNIDTLATGTYDLAAGTVGGNNGGGFFNNLAGMVTDTGLPFLASMAAGGAGGALTAGGAALSNLGGMTGNDALKYGGMLVGGASKLGGFGGSVGGDGAFLGGYEDMAPVPTNVASNVVDPTYGVNLRPDPYQGLGYSQADIEALKNGTYSGPEQAGGGGTPVFPSTQAVDYGMTPTGTPAGGLTPTGGGLGLTQTAAGGAAITGGLAGAAGSTAVPDTVAGEAGASIGGITGAGTSVFDTFLDKLSNNPVQTAIKAAQVVSGIASGVNAMNAPISPTDAQKMADPFASSRQQYIDKLNALMANPSLAMSQPGYQFALQQGMQGLNRNLSKSGMGTSTPGFPGTPASGAAGIAQQKYGQNFALKSYDDYVNQLSALSGATQRPSAGSDAFITAQKAASDAANSGWKSVAQASGGLLDLFGSKSPQTGSTVTAPPVGGGAAAGGNFSPASWNTAPNWYLGGPSTTVDGNTTIPDYTNYGDPGGGINYNDYNMFGP